MKRKSPRVSEKKADILTDRIMKILRQPDNRNGVVEIAEEVLDDIIRSCLRGIA